MPQPARPRAVAARAAAGAAWPTSRSHQHHHEQGRREEPDDGIDLDGAAPPDPGHDERRRRRDDDLPQVAREIVGAERHPSRSRFVGLRHERGGERMLDARAESCHEEADEQRGEAAREPRDEEAEGGDRSARSEEARLAPALGHHARRDLKRRHAPAVDRPQQADLSVREAELARPDGEEHVDEVGEAVVDEVDRGGGAQHGPGAVAVGRGVRAHDGGGKSGRFSSARSCPARPDRRCRTICRPRRPRAHRGRLFHNDYAEGNALPGVAPSAAAIFRSWPA